MRMEELIENDLEKYGAYAILFNDGIPEKHLPVENIRLGVDARLIFYSENYHNKEDVISYRALGSNNMLIGKQILYVNLKQ